MTYSIKSYFKRNWGICLALYAVFFISSMVMSMSRDSSFIANNPAEFCGIIIGAGFWAVVFQTPFILYDKHREKKRMKSAVHIMTDAECMAALKKTILTLPKLYEELRFVDNPEQWMTLNNLKLVQIGIRNVTHAELSIAEVQHYLRIWFMQTA